MFLTSELTIRLSLKMPRGNEFTNNELRDMICVYAQVNYNACAAVRRYVQLYPNRIVPSRKKFQRLYSNLGESGSFRKKNSGGRPKIITADMEDEILTRIIENPELSTRRLQAATGVSKSSVSRILHTEKLYPYHFTPVQNLLPNDLPRRLQFCQSMLGKINQDPIFLKKVLFTDEATFTRRGVFNWRNNHYYDFANPHQYKETHFQHEFSINIWCGIIGDNFIGPFELPNRLNAVNYLEFLQNDLGILLDEVPLIVRQDMWFMQDGAPPHYPLIVREHLNNNFPHRWIGRGSEFPWPPRSPEFNPLDFYVWGYLKSLVYNSEIHNQNELLAKIHEAANTLKNGNAMFFKVRQHLQKSLRKCIEVNGGHFQHLMK